MRQSQFIRKQHKIAVVGFAGFLQDYTLTQFRMPRIGPIIISSVLDEAGYKVKMYSEGIGQFDKAVLEEIISADVVCLAVLTYGANRAYALCNLIRQMNPNASLVMGDVHPTIMPDHALRQVDYVIRGEGDSAILELMGELEKPPENRDFHWIAGLSFWESDRLIHNPKRDRPVNIDIMPKHELIHGFYENLGINSLRKGKFTMAVVQASRGCPVACSFCLGSAILGKDYRMRGEDGFIESLNRIRELSNNKKLRVFIIDNHFFINKPWTKSILRRIIAEKYNFIFIAFGQYFIGKDQEMLELLKRANFDRIFVGFESINPQTLKEFRKRQNEKSMRECIAGFHKHGVGIHGSFMLGGETDTLETAESTIKFAIDTGIATASFFGLCEYPFEEYGFVPTTNCLPPNRLIPKANLDYYNINFVSIFPKLMRPSQLQRKLIEAHERFFSRNRVWKSIFKFDFGDAADRSLGWWGQRKMIDQMHAYVPWLEEQEYGLYDANDRLIEENLPSTPFKFENPYPTLYHPILAMDPNIQPSIRIPKENAMVKSSLP